MNPSVLPAGQELKSTNRPIYGADSIRINDTIYVYGGFYNVAPWNKEALWTLDSSINKLTQLETDPYASPAVIYHSLQSLNSSTLITFGGHLNEHNITPPAEPEYLRYYQFNFDSLKWTPLQKKNPAIETPFERFWHTTSKSDNTIYLYGGMNMTQGLNDFWKYNAAIDGWTRLPNVDVARCGHTATMMDNGKMVVLGGYDCSNSSLLTQTTKSLISLDTAAVYDTNTNEWYEQTLKGDIPQARTFHTAVKSRNNHVIICGGQNGEVEPFQSYLSGEHASDMTAILDMNTWEWHIPDASPYQPFPRSHAIANIVNETKMIYGFGINYHTVYDGLYVFDLEINQWLPPAGVYHHDSQHYSVGLIVGLSIFGAFVGSASVVLLGYWLIKRHGSAINNLFAGIRRNIWNPRPGEPLWAEISRLLFRFSFLAIFITMTAVLVLQVKNSPIIDQQYYDHTPDYTVAAPATDIRFCFDGWLDTASPVLQCATDFGEPCSNYLINMTENVRSNLNYYGTKLSCQLFRPPKKTFKLGRTNDRMAHSGSFLKFYYYGQPSNNSILHVELYHPDHDANLPVYNVTGDFEWYSPDENAKFQSSEQMNLKTENVFEVHPTYATRIGYELLERQKMDGSTWNYIGFGSTRVSQYHLKSNQMSADGDTTYSTNPQPLGSLHVYPMRYDVTVMREQRAFTLVNGMGIVGGIFGLIVGFQANLFGYRPRSPWGIVHRWSVGLMRRSLLQGLKARFPTTDEVHIPIVHPVHRRFSEALLSTSHDASSPINTTKKTQMARLEERLHVFELLFQAYYIDDEVFRSLQNAQK
ncbi:hypothetical protein HMPREF1544_01819 [Mucor circinelloides 1006PhL]|uniref:Attractin/MKLN-like beta-propeller domain-containing protein n=1 Tax=Mucor circinelloides f. circinelloides (strain 1006PhL) TaxID=1220926 RepID=S2JS35_MUCC1|nr:hypothetical protein HMPREF1544_01819 [Mucor circinelloides 1006PhL]